MLDSPKIRLNSPFQADQESGLCCAEASGKR
jgi:hypothetical protein